MQITNWTGIRTPEQLYTVDQIIKMLLNNRYFIANSTTLCFGNRTDSFLPSNITYTVNFIKALEQLKLNNPLIIVTKKIIPEDVLQYIQNLEHVKVVFFISYSGLPSHIEKGIKAQDSLNNFVNLKKHNIPAVHFWRPILEINSGSGQIRDVLAFTSKYAIASVYIGLKLSKELNRIYKERDEYFHLPSNLDDYGEYFPEYAEIRILDIVQSEFPVYPLYKHSSCAISLALGIPDYNATVYKDSICRESQCPSWKRAICENSKIIPEVSNVESLLRRIGSHCRATVTPNHVEIFGELAQEEYVFLLHHLNYPIIAREIKYNLVLRGSIFKR